MGRREDLQEQTKDNLELQINDTAISDRQHEFNKLIHERLFRLENGVFPTTEEKPTDPTGKMTPIPREAVRRETPSMGVEPPDPPPDPKNTGKRRIG